MVDGSQRGVEDCGRREEGARYDIPIRHVRTPLLTHYLTGETECSSVEMDFGNNGRFSWPENPWDLAQLKDIIEDWQTFMISHDGLLA